jgi:hypothetical protein
MRLFYLLTWFAFFALPAAQSPAIAKDIGDPSPAETTRGFTVTIDGMNVPINPGETVPVKLKDGRTVTVGLIRNPFSQWSDDMLSFDHPSGLTVATQKLSNNITQHLLASAVGTVIIVQEYEGLDPTMLKQFMMNELIKDDVKIGSAFRQSDTAKTLASGIKLSGIEGVLKSRTELKTVNVLSYGKDGQGVILVTVITDDRKATDQAFLDQFWNTLALKF